MNRIRRELTWLAQQFENNGQYRQASYYRRLLAVTHRQPEHLDFYRTEFKRGRTSLMAARRQRRARA
ncbi:hypothetical protein [Agrococcus casei]|uniref:hypothetical protein n=1 Tax=Agrococcus casei TaxID=343512 RepID=UPI003F9D31F5